MINAMPSRLILARSTRQKTAWRYFSATSGRSNHYASGQAEKLSAEDRSESSQFEQTSVPAWFRRSRRRAVLAISELHDSAAEQKQLWKARLRQGRQDLETLKGLPFSEVAEGAHLRFREANRRFDDRFNETWDRLVDNLMNLAKKLRDDPALLTRRFSRLQRHVQQLRRRLLGVPEAPSEDTAEKPTAAAGKALTSPPCDAVALGMMGAAAGSVLQGFLGPGVLLGGWGLARACRRFVVLCIDTEDPNRLFRWAPSSLQKQKAELFVQLHHELHAMRRIRAGDLKYMTRPGDRAWEQGMDARYDHTPVTLFEESMTAIAVHPRVQEWVGETVLAKTEPDKVVYRIHEGISEVFLGWDIKGELGLAEVQVKATGSIVDFIYIFPQGRDHYGLKPVGFVIRPTGDAWSQDADTLPKDLKKPFGASNGRIVRNREGIFDWDYEVKEFRHGYEGENHPRAQAYRRWFGKKS